MRIVVAPDRFAGTMSAVQAGDAMAAGWSDHAAGDQLVARPLSDGGTGLLDTLAATLPGQLRSVTVTGPVGTAVPAAMLVVAAVDDPSGRSSVYVEAAQACGPHLAPESGHDPARTSTWGVGELLRAAVDTGAERVVVGCGASCTVDGGAGALGALGVVAGQARLDAGPAGYPGLDAGTPLTGLAEARRLLDGVELVVATDVDAPLLGHHGAVTGSARRSGARADQLPGLEAAMTGLAGSVLEAARGAGAVDAGRLVALPGAGAAGGLGFALLALGGRRAPGAAVVAEAIGLQAVLAGADLVLTGEGSFDWRSLRGSPVTAVAHKAMQVGVPVVVVAGQVTVGRRELATAGIEAAYPVAETPAQLQRSMADPAGTLRARVRRVARTWHRPG